MKWGVFMNSGGDVVGTLEFLSFYICKIENKVIS